jgi:hypothetical protein
MTSIETDKIFLPRNELEIQLLAAKEGRASPRSFVTYLFENDIYVLSTSDALSSPVDTRALLSLSDDDHPTRLAIFSSRARAETFQSVFPSYQHVLKASFSDVLRVIESGTGIMLNPGQSAGMTIPPEGVIELKREFD